MPPCTGNGLWNVGFITVMLNRIRLLALFLPGLAWDCCGALGLEWTEGQGYRSAVLQVPKNGRTGFTLLSPSQTGIQFTNHLTEARANQNRILENGSGVALGDVDSDGWCDVYLCRIDGPNVLYRNRGNWQFEDITASAGVACHGQSSTGAVFADVDGDGDLDLLVNGIGVGTRLFLNDGHGRFTEVVASGLVRQYGSTSLALADIDGDGDLDLYVTNYRTDTIRDAPPGVNARFYRRADGQITVEPSDRFLIVSQGSQAVKMVERGEPDFLYVNDGYGHFTPVPWTQGAFLDEAGQPLASAPLNWGLTVAFHDLNGDGAPDIYVCNDFNFSPDEIWINDGHGRFRALPKLAMREMTSSSMAVDFADINRDGYVDFLVVEMLSRDHVRRQTQRLNFRPEMMWLPFGVIDNRPEYMRNTLFLNRGDDTFAEIAQLSGVAASEWTWSAIFVDVDLDGYEDLLMATGSGHDVLDSDVNLRLQELDRSGHTSKATRVLSMFPPLRTPNLAFRNRGDLTFEEVSSQWAFDLREVSNGMALADLDNDGDLDVVINNLNAPVALYRNDTVAPRLAVRLKGLPPNTRGIGASIKVTGGPVPQSQEMICGGRYLSCDENMRVFAAGDLTNDLRIEVTWRRGTRSVVEHAAANRLYEIDEPVSSADGLFAGSEHGEVERRQFGSAGRPFVRGRSKTAAATSARITGGPVAHTTRESSAVSEPKLRTEYLFEDVSASVNHSHHEEPFDDFARQLLLPKRLSQLGPGVSWFDLDGDGYDDLVIADGRGGKVAIFLNQHGAGFEALDAPMLNQALVRDQTTVLGWRRSDHEAVLLAGSANYEDGQTTGGCVRRYDLSHGVVDDAWPAAKWSTGPLALGDINGDGSLDLFVGGRVIGGRYPEPASSLLLRNQEGKLVLDAQNSAVLAHLGLVSGAVFSDLDGDGFPELILACEWGPIRVFKNNHGRFAEVTEQLGLADFKGWWNGVTTGDFDGDGKLDIVASNWGRNTPYECHRTDGLRLYFGDIDGSGTVQVLESYYDRTLGKVVPRRTLDVLSAALPYLHGRFPTFHSFATASIQEILADRISLAKELRASWLDSTLFLNRGDHFEVRSLPLEAQLAPAFGIVAADFDGDGNEDLFLSQNFFPVETETSRYDSGRGLLLKGDGTGRFRAVPGQESGLMIYGDQRGCAAADYDGDGRLDLVVTQNANATKLYHNLGAKPGLRLRLQGSGQNPQAVGATVRLLFGQRAGPAHEVHAGSGYWSQDSAICVLGTPEPPTGVWVRWPGGRTTQNELSFAAREVLIDSSGRLKVLR
jgi:hypothetical protein